MLKQDKIRKGSAWKDLKKFRSEKNLAPKKVVKKMLGRKNLLVKKNFGSEKFLVKK